MVKDDVWANGFQDALVAQGQFYIIQNNKSLWRINNYKKLALKFRLEFRSNTPVRW